MPTVGEPRLTVALVLSGMPTLLCCVHVHVCVSGGLQEERGVEPISPEINSNPNHLGALRPGQLCAFSGSVFSSTLTCGSASLLRENMGGAERLVNFCKGAQRRWHTLLLRATLPSYTDSLSKLRALWGSPASGAALEVTQPGHRPREGTVGSNQGEVRLWRSSTKEERFWEWVIPVSVCVEGLGEEWSGGGSEVGVEEGGEGVEEGSWEESCLILCLKGFLVSL